MHATFLTSLLIPYGNEDATLKDAHIYDSILFEARVIAQLYRFIAGWNGLFQAEIGEGTQLDRKHGPEKGVKQVMWPSSPLKYNI